MREIHPRIMLKIGFIFESHDSVILMLEKNNYSPFRDACSHSRIEVAQYLVDTVIHFYPEKLREMLFSNHDSAFWDAIRNGKIDVLKFLMNISIKHFPEEMPNYIRMFNICRNTNNKEITDYLDGLAMFYC